MRTLIFGCGYLGRRVARAWLEGGHEVYAVTRSPQNAETFRQKGIRALIADVCDESSLTNLPEVDVVLHSIGFDRSSGKSQQDVTCGGARNLLTAIKGLYKRFIHISSTSVYGQSAGEWVDESSECDPVQPGGQLALEAETLIRDIHANERCQAFILRLAGIYGPGRLLSRIETLQAGQPLSGRGDAWLNLIHVDDAVRAIQCCTKSELAGDTYIIADDCPIERREYFERLAQLVNAPPPVFDANQVSQRGSGGLNKRCSNRKALQQLGWSPVFSSFNLGLPASIGKAVE